MTWTEIYRTLNRLKQEIKERMVERDYDTDWMDAWEEVCEINDMFSKWDSESSDQFIRSLIEEMMADCED